MSEADFALQWLDFQQNKIFNRGKRIFLYDGDPNYEINPYGMLDTKIRCGQKLWDKEEEDQENFSSMGWKELDELGYAVKAEYNEEFFWNQYQKLYYLPIKKRKDSLGLNDVAFRSAKHRGTLSIEHDPIRRRFRLKGSMVLASSDLPEYAGISDWVYYDEDKPREIVPRKASKISREQSRAFMRSRIYGDSLKSHAEYQPIPEIPLIISEDKKIVCMRKEDTCQRMITTGESGGGKSIDGDSLIPYFKDGELKVDKIKDIKLDDKNIQVPSLNGWTQIKGYSVHEDNRKRIKITTRTGKKIIGTPDHSFIVMNTKGEIIEKKGDELKLNDCFITPNQFELGSNKSKNQRVLIVEYNYKNGKIIRKSIQINKMFAFFLGIYLAEGSLSGKSICISNMNLDIQNRVKEFCISNNIKARMNKTEVRFNCIQLHTWIKKECYYKPKTRKGKGSDAERKKIPNIVYNGNEEFIYDFLSGVFSGDGYIQNRNWLHGNRTKESYSIGIDLCSERFIDDLIFLLASIGILTNKLSKDRRNRLSISGRYVKLFLKNIKLYDKKQKIERICEQDHFDVVPFVRLMRDVLKDNHLSKKWADLGIKESVNKYGYCGRRRMERLVKKFEKINPNNKTLIKIKKLLNLSYFYDRITKIEKITTNEFVYDLETEDNTFLANNIFVHNSVFVNGVAGRLFHHWQDRVGWLIDPLNQFYDLSLPQDFNEFNKINKWINNFPTPIPAVQLHLACRFNPKIVHDKISLLLTLNFEEFLKNYKFYTDGIDDYKIKGSTRYFNQTIEFVKDAKTGDEYTEAILNNIPILNTKSKAGMVYKWSSTMDTIFNEKFISNLYEKKDNIAEELSIELKDGTKMSGHPFIMCMEAGLVPVLNISAARKQRWMRNYLADLMNQIVMHQIERGKQQKRMFIIADELNEIYEVGKPKDNAFMGFEELYRQGRFNNIGFVGNTQSLDKLNPEMYKNATHICCVYMKDADERRKIGKTFNLDKDVYNKIEELKPLEMMIFSKQPFVTYDRWGRKKVSNRKWFKGRIIPPINHHKIPPKGG